MAVSPEWSEANGVFGSGSDIQVDRARIQDKKRSD
jgi:hypothetical protein